MKRAILALSLLGSSPAMAVDVLVGPTRLYTTIQDGIDAANDGDRVLVDAGTYTEDVYILNRYLTIESVSGSANTKIVNPGMGAYGDYNVIDIFGGGGVSMVGFTIDGGFQRRGIYVAWYSIAVFDDLVVINGINSDGWPGGGLDVYGAAEVEMINCVFDGNTATDDSAGRNAGGNIAVEYGATLAILGNTTLTNGVAGVGGGLWVEWSATADVMDTVFDKNTVLGSDAVQMGGGLFVDRGAYVTVDSSTFLGNSTGLNGEGGGVYSMGDVVLTENTFDGNYAHKGGGVVQTDWGSLLDLGGFYYGNDADLGGAIACLGTPECTLQGTWMESNTAEDGGALLLADTYTDLEHAVFCFNDATAGGYGDGDGGAVLAERTQVTTGNSVFFENTASRDGGALRWYDGMVYSANNHYIYNTTGQAGGAMSADSIEGLGTAVDSLNDLVAWNSGGSNGALDIPGLDGIVMRYGWLWSNLPDAGNISVDPSTLINSSDPLLQGVVMGDCTLAAMHPQLGSPLVNTGDPLMNDPDGSIADIGAFGGPGADQDLFGDTDGDGVIDLFDCDRDAAGVGSASMWFEDSDGDGWGSVQLGTSCVAPLDGVLDGTDCDDTDGNVGPPDFYWLDSDGDGYGAPSSDSVVSCLPLAGWVTNDWDCDDQDYYAVPGLLWWPDADGDGFGDGHYDALPACSEPYGYVDNGSDCDDVDSTLNPNTWWYTDRDLDEMGGDELDTQACDPGDGFSLTTGDCNDLDPTIMGPVDWYVDKDDDGYGGEDVVQSCERLDGMAAEGGDCNLEDPAIYPGATEYCDDIDQDCDGLTRDPESVDALEWPVDADGDGFGSNTETQRACDSGDGLSDVASDCDDSDPAIFPGTEEVWYDGVDQDCDRANDFDQDGDGFATAEIGDGDDCNDTNPDIFPGAPDGFDDDVDANCDGVSPKTWIAGGGGGCGCDASGGNVPGFAWLLGVLIALRRKDARSR